ncbi:Histone-lysine N-methyltransferase SETMAR, partial [Habropoda laboriosa]
QKLHQLDIKVLLHLLYSSDLSLIDFYFFGSFDSFLTQALFRKQENIENAFQQFLFLRDSNFYISKINALVNSWQRCIEYYGNYFKQKRISSMELCFFFWDDLMIRLTHVLHVLQRKILSTIVKSTLFE